MLFRVAKSLQYPIHLLEAQDQTTFGEAAKEKVLIKLGTNKTK